MSPPRAPERDGEIALSLALVAGQGEVEEVRQPLEELLGLVPGEDVLGDRGVRAGPVAQLLDEERVWQEPAVDGEVGVARQAVLVAEGHERDGHAAARDAIDEVAERGTELVHGEPTRVDDAIRDLTQRSQLLALTADAVSQAAALGRGMRPPRLAEAPHQHVVARFEVHHLDVDAALPELPAHARELGEQAPLAHVDAECHARHLLARALPELDEAGDQRDGEIIDAVEAEVLEAPDRGALAGAREPRHDDDA